MTDLLLLIAFFALGFWKQRGAAPRTIKRSIVAIVLLIVGMTIYNLFNLPESAREIYREQPVFSVVVLLLSNLLLGLFCYGLFRLGMFCAKKFAAKAGTGKSAKQNINPDYDSWPTVEREIEKGDVEEAKNCFGKDMLLSYEALETRGWDEKFHQQYRLIKQTASPFFQCFSDHTPIMDLQDDGSILLLYQGGMDDDSFLYMSWPVKKSPTGNLHRKGVISRTTDQNVAITLRYELCTGDDEQWWQLESPDANFLLTTARGLVYA